MKSVRHIVGAIALLTLVAGPLHAQEKIKEGARTATEKTKEGLSKTGEVMTDGWITTRVHERMVGEDMLKGSDISVDTDHHVVTLRGTVMGREGRAKAARIASHTEGVHRVVNHLKVGPKQG